ncbi:MAG: ATP-binding protein [Pseudomonadota bacterium]
MEMYQHAGDWYHNYSGIPQKMNRKLDKELSTLLYKQAPLVSFSLFALLGVVLYFFWGKLPEHILLIWAAVNLIPNFALLLAAWAYRRADEIKNSKAWINGYVYLTMVQDFSWGMIGPISFLVEDQVYQLLTLLMLGGMSAGGIVTRGVVFKAYAVGILGLLTPITITMALQNEPFTEGMLLQTVIFMLFLLSVAKSYSAVIRKNFLLWLDNEKLVEKLKRSNEQVEDANRGLTIEIEQRKRMEEKLVNAKERAERASEVKNQFLASVSHELRTPLNGIIGFASILDKKALTPEQQVFTNQISKSADNLLNIVNDILDITSIEAGHLKLTEEPFSLRTEIGEVMAILKPVAERKNLRLDFSIDENVTEWLIGDANRLRQIVSNLLSNALKYTEQGQVNLKITRKGEAEGRVVLRFDVEDTGIGIPEEALSTLFDNFTRVESFEARRNDGVGLGLAIVKNLLQQMGGNITVESEPGVGSCFRFELLFACGEEISAEEDDRESQDNSSLQHLKILVVDDNEVNRLVLTTFLENNGIASSVAKSGYEALQIIQEQNFDVVMLDIQMPDISGFDVADEIRAMNKGAPALIAVTAHAFPEQREAILNAGFNEFLIKPISEDALLKTLAGLKPSGSAVPSGMQASL